jgi:hypothetical protein
MKIASMEGPQPRGSIIGRQISGPLLSEAEHWLEEHQQPLPHPACDRAQ